MTRAKGWLVGAWISAVMWWLIICGLSGCRSLTMVDPETGAPETVYQVDPNTAAKVELIAEGAIAAGTAASIFVPGLAGVISLLVGGLGTWKTIKPKLLAATKAKDAAYKGGRVLAEALDEIKRNPEIWDKVGPVIQKAARPMSEAENAIRGFRGLEPK